MIHNFLFHRVNPIRDRLWDPMDVDLFEKCIQYISKKYRVVLFENFMLSDSRTLTSNIATIMFDDGYKDNIEYAVPILEKYKCKASFYVVTDCIDHNIPTWTHNLEYLFLHTCKSDITIDFDFLPDDFKITKLSDLNARIHYVSKLKPRLKKLNHYHRQLVLNTVNSAFDDVVIPGMMMDWNDLRLLKEKGHYIGSHTASHQMLGTIDNNEVVLHELSVSAKRIKDELGYFPLSISYPIGSFNTITKALSQQAGYKIGLAVKQQIFDPQKDDIFEVPRIELYNESWFKTRLRIVNTLENIKSFIRYR